MRNLYLLRGAPGAGKSTWISNNNLQPYTISADTIRLLMQSPVLNSEGHLVISQENDYKVWELLMRLLEDRMSRGELIFVDATHYKKELLNKYKNLVNKYRYRVFVVDFTDVSLENLFKRNKNRESYKFVPEDAIEKMYTLFNTDLKEVKNSYKIVSPDEAIVQINNVLFNYNDDTDYKKVVIFGDIHGCFEPLKEYFEKNPFNEKINYIFVGDYLDRGIQNKEVLEFLISLQNKKNVLLLEGNHEKWLRMYSDLDGDYEQCKEVIKNKDFILKTIPQIKDISIKDIKQLCRHFAQIGYFQFGAKKYFISHAGIGNVPNQFISTEEYIKGQGGYEDIYEVYESFLKNTEERYNDVVLIHGHRNMFNFSAKHHDRIYNLCSNIEIGAPLRILEIDKNNNETVVEIKNTVFDKELDIYQDYNSINDDDIKDLTNEEIINVLKNSRHIVKNDLDNGIVSFNFSRSVFANKIWNTFTCKARGLFVDIDNNSVVARSYDKFFNWGERPETRIKSLVRSLKYPVTAYKKYNGFLALVSWDYKNDNFFITSKSSNKSEHSEFARNIFFNIYTEDQRNTIKEYIQTNNVTFVYECIDPENDPHIIEYEEKDIILLDIIKNDLKSTIITDYEDLKKFAEKINIKYKEKISVFNDFRSLFEFKRSLDKDDTYLNLNNDKDQIEGYVFEDTTGFKIKYKTNYYNFWKQMRNLRDKMAGKSNSIPHIFRNKIEINVFNKLKELKDNDTIKDYSIIDIRNMIKKEKQINNV